MTRLGAYEYYFRSKLDRRTEGFGLNVAVCPPNESHPVHEHSNPGIVVVLRGQYLEEFEGRETVIRPLTARYRPANAAHSHRVGPEGVTALHLEFCDEWLEESGCELAKVDKFQISGQERIARSSIQTLLALAGSDGPDWQDAGLSITEQFLSPSRPEARVPSWLIKAKCLIDEQFAEKLALGQIAYDVGISKMHLASTFRHHYGCSVTEYATKRKLEFAASLILDGWPVGHAGVEAGFFDHAYFAKRFHSEFRHRPSLLQTFKKMS